MNAARFILLGAFPALALAGCAGPLPMATLSDGRTGRVHFETASYAPSPSLRVGLIFSRVTISGDLALPPLEGNRRIPAVIMLHGCDGSSRAAAAWRETFRAAGWASFAIDTFAGRSLTETCTGRTLIHPASRVADAIRALDLLTTHPRIDPERIVVMGMGEGGLAALWAAAPGFQRVVPRGTAKFAVHLALYPTNCGSQLASETEGAGAPIALFLGTADDAVSVAACRDYVDRVRAFGREAALYFYPGALHGFDDPGLERPRRYDDRLNFATCRLIEDADGRLVDAATRAAPRCVSQGWSAAFDAQAFDQAARDVRAFLATVIGARRG